MSVTDQPKTAAPIVPRAEGTGVLGVKRRGEASVLGTLRTSGCLKLLFPPKPDRLEAVMINTSGGLTGGDRLTLEAEVAEDAHLVLTTQAAERAYRAAEGEARVASQIKVARGGSLYWLPQELILFDGSALNRRLTCDLADGARALLVEPVIFGRALMGETLRDAFFHDRINVTRSGQPLYRDATRFSGDVARHLARPGVMSEAGAMASVVFADPDAEMMLPVLRTMMPATGGVTLLRPDLVALRLVAEDGFALRRDLLPVLDLLSQNRLPASWRL